MDTSRLVDLVFTGGTALAGLILVFLGGVLTAYESYDETEKQSVRAKYKRRARVALWGFVFALASAVFALIAGWSCLPFSLTSAIVCLGASFLLVLVAAFQAIGDIS